jgi:hypothetical protein
MHIHRYTHQSVVGSHSSRLVEAENRHLISDCRRHFPHLSRFAERPNYESMEGRERGREREREMVAVYKGLDFTGQIFSHWVYNSNRKEKVSKTKTLDLQNDNFAVMMMIVLL